MVATPGFGASADAQSVGHPCELHSRRSRQECRSCAAAGVAAEPALARASDDEQQRRLRVLFLDEGSIATTDKAEGGAGGAEHLPTRMRVAADTIVQSLSGAADALLDC